MRQNKNIKYNACATVHGVHGRRYERKVGHMGKRMRLCCMLLLGVMLCACAKDEKRERGEEPAPTENASQVTPTAEPTEAITPTVAPTDTPTPTPTEKPLDPDGDEDGDGAPNGWEAEHGYDPRQADSTFADVEISCAEDGLPVLAKMILSADWKTICSVRMTKQDATELVNDTIPGYLGPAFRYEGEGDLGLFTVIFELKPESISGNPTVYGLNEETNRWFAFDTAREGNRVSAVTTEPGIYIVMDRDAHEKEMAKGRTLTLQEDTSADTNGDGISDYLTKLMCDGELLYATGAKVFGNLTYEEVQSNADFDNNGVKNGDEIAVVMNQKAREGAVEFNGHFYQLFDQGYLWDAAQSFCESWGGHLVTITSEEEQNFIVEFLKDGKKKCYWIGANDAREEGVWEWVTGETWEYAFWASGEPNNDGAEDYAEIVTWRSYGWNDGERDGDAHMEDYSKDNHGFVCEWEQGENATGVYVRRKLP